ncbi:hypothetical protein [Prosthecochloris sp. SCSIO W1101]|uniref:hypothetical protein n=1 Tax=Prosthecochloris sp. SCSIO W1101 TaxID=2992242 RepID=UPI002AC85339|nr:hypothetical protein [Prosthecochloris sp. SCSIO W1101]
MQNRSIKFVIPLLATAVALVISALLIMTTGRDPLMIYQKMFSMTFGSDYGTGQIVFRTTSLILTGLAVAIPFKVKLLNIGGEGQVLAGAFTAAFVGIMLPPQTPPLIAISICSTSAMIAGSHRPPCRMAESPIRHQRSNIDNHAEFHRTCFCRLPLDLASCRPFNRSYP